MGPLWGGDAEGSPGAQDPRPAEPVASSAWHSWPVINIRGFGAHQTVSVPSSGKLIKT